MKKVLIIGSTTVDIVIDVDKLPSSKGDVNVKGQTASLGGCAFNVSRTVKNFGVPYILFSPVGGGVFGDFVRNEMSKRGVLSRLPDVEGDNGCCYCFVESSGERTFMAVHGSEYYISSRWLDKIDVSEIQSVYICGIEIEEKTGGDIVSFLEKHPELPVFFAPGPRYGFIDPDLMKRIMKLHPVIHLNDDEAHGMTDCDDLRQAAKKIYNLTGNSVIITLGEKGACCFDGSSFATVPGVRAENTVDTIGAGDSHIGSVISCLYRGDDLRQAVKTANTVAGAVVGVKGALLPKEKFDTLF